MTRGEFGQFCSASQSSLSEGTKEQIDSLYEEYLKFVEFLKKKQMEFEEEKEEEEDLDLASCEQCGERAWDGYICHACGLKII